MPSGFYRYTVGDLLTGRQYRTVELADTSWATVFDDADTLAGAFNLRSVDPVTGTRIWADARSDAAVAKSYLACEWVAPSGAATMLAAGPIWTHAYSDDTGKLQLGAAGMESYFDHRKLLPVLAAGQTAGDVDTLLTGAELGLIAKRLIAQALAHTGGNVPVVLPTDASLGGEGGLEREWPGYELASVGAELRTLAQADDGPEIQFVPRRKAGDPRFIEWVMRIGTSATGYQIRQTYGRPWLLDSTTASGPISRVDVNTDGTKMGDRSWAAGSGMGLGREVALSESTTLRGYGYPLLEVESTATDKVMESDTLDSFAAGEQKKASRPAETISVEVNAGAFWSVASGARPGDLATLRIGAGHGYLPPGDMEVRMLTIRSSGASTLSIECADTAGAI